MLNNKIRIFGSVENTFLRDPSVSVRAPYDFSGANAILTEPALTAAHPDTAIPERLNIILPGGTALGGSDNRWSGSGTIMFDFTPVQFRVAGSYSYDKSQNQTVLANLLNQSRLGVNTARDGFVNLRLSHVLSPTLFFNLVMGIIGSFQVFDTVYVLTSGGPLGSTKVLVFYLYEHAFKFFDMGYASAVAYLLFAAVFILTMLQMKYLRGRVHYTS